VRAAIPRDVRRGAGFGDLNTQTVAHRWAQAITSRRQWSWLAFALAAAVIATVGIAARLWWLLPIAVLEGLAALGSRMTWNTAVLILSPSPPANDKPAP